MSAPVDTLCPPLLNELGITLSPRRMFDISQFVRFISHTPTLKELDEARVWRRSDCILLVITNISPRQAHAENLMQAATSCEYSHL
jgi:hypothetical protein